MSKGPFEKHNNRVTPIFVTLETFDQGDGETWPDQKKDIDKDKDKDNDKDKYD